MKTNPSKAFNIVSIFVLVCAIALTAKTVYGQFAANEVTVAEFIASPFQTTSEVAVSITSKDTGKSEQEASGLTPAQYQVLKEKGTEIPYTSELLKEKRPGTYVTADCNEPVFRSEQKFDSGTGWPSFSAAIEGSVILQDDADYGQVRTEVVGSKCGGHLGHLFADGPSPTGLRYCINGIALKFIPDDPNEAPVVYEIDPRTKDELGVRK